MNRTKWILGIASAVVGSLTVSLPAFADEIPKWAYGLAMIGGPMFVAVVGVIQARPIE